MTGPDPSLPPATSRRELRERERAAASSGALPAPAEPAIATPMTAAPPSTFAAPAHVVAAPASARPSVRHSTRGAIVSKLLSGAALVSAGALVVGMSLPANALDAYAPSSESDTALLAVAPKVEGQEVDVVEDVADVSVDRDGFEVKSWAQVLRDKYSRGSFAYSVYWTGPIRWPFPYEVPITDGYGPRAAPCSGCSTFHYAIDLVPGAGTPIYAIADGVVIAHTDGHGSWGNFVQIQHTINGRTVISSYAHMQTGSSPLQVGDRISVGDFVGLVGATGQVTAPHLHLEIEDDGVRVDPFIWLTQNTAH
ncbi:M23 family metallopeptidase [Protaetiibacter mangrovi]|uniref:M23 family metallopeptidase n=1 Tax=Protaetiibacter mangrovi TaxID=2970926 RepID=A0ABT1ZG65_9MICO|nr:M23 family metallopeptidase [Protaetiibacter mangrovi]MCS0499703.1 M23 family metallopeptidase [Protaetiibacter mangrovi]